MPKVRLDFDAAGACVGWTNAEYIQQPTFNPKTKKIEKSPDVLTEVSDADLPYVRRIYSRVAGKIIRTPLPAGTIETEKADAAKLAARALINRTVDALIEGGFTSDALGSVHRYKGDRDSQSNLMGVNAEGIDVDYPCFADGDEFAVERLHTAAQIAQVFKDGSARKKLCLKTARAGKAAVEAAADEAAVIVARDAAIADLEAL